MMLQAVQKQQQKTEREQSACYSPSSGSAMYNAHCVTVWWQSVQIGFGLGQGKFKTSTKNFFLLLH